MSEYWGLFPKRINLGGRLTQNVHLYPMGKGPLWWTEGNRALSMSHLTAFPWWAGVTSFDHSIFPSLIFKLWACIILNHVNSFCQIFCFTSKKINYYTRMKQVYSGKKSQTMQTINTWEVSRNWKGGVGEEYMRNKGFWKGWEYFLNTQWWIPAIKICPNL